MTYQEFIECIEAHQTESIRALSIENSCATDKIPDEILLLIPNLIELLKSCFSKFCKEDQILALHGLQPCMLALESESQKSRDLKLSKNALAHLCCSLQYMVLSKDSQKKEEPKKVWDKTQTMVIDFTTGKVMDNEEYLAQALKLPKKGEVYGEMNPLELTKLWANIERKSLQRSLSLGCDDQATRNSPFLIHEESPAFKTGDLQGDKENTIGKYQDEYKTGTYC